ncbi:MAG TPA: EthD family reductase [Solirubrobacteraceae bacterium]|nr:EthD family reductase [Solirubrobacteraceae bacterium]
MYKLAGVIRFPREKTASESQAYWRDVHGPLTSVVEPVIAYAQNHVLGPDPVDVPSGGGEALFDGYACQWFADEETAEATVATPQWQEVVADGAVFQDTDWTMAGPVVEHVVLDGPLAPFKIVRVGSFGDAVGGEDRRRAWLDATGPLVASLPGVARYVQDHGLEVTGGRDGAFAVLDELYFEDEDAYRAARASPEWDAVHASERPLFESGWLWSAVVREYVLKGHADGRS